ncbi:MAG TPA: hypothetical protein P5232_04505 [Candidatus Moranbacteria bacterium]|nr:hypothetical protein [Candidatus Moranbacteria bacterium]
MKTQITKYIIAGLVVIFGAASWFYVDEAINVPASSTWLIPAIWFSLFFIAIALGAILIKQKYLIFSALAIGLFSSLIFTFSFWHILALAFSFLLIFLGAERIAKDLKLNIKFDIAKSVRTGKTMLILALSIAITSQYYSEIKNNNNINIIPKFETGDAVSKILPMIYPDMKDNQKTELTVDEFISEISKQNAEGFLGNILESQGLNEKNTGVSKEQMKKMLEADQGKIIEQERESLSQITGMKLTGQEKISDVFSEMINGKINEFFSTSFKADNLPFLPFIASFILFLTVASLGSFLGSIVGYFVAFIFWILRKAELVKVSKVMTEVEVVE